LLPCLAMLFDLKYSLTLLFNVATKSRFFDANFNVADVAIFASD
jgi:hypothetical protein